MGLDANQHVKRPKAEFNEYLRSASGPAGISLSDDFRAVCDVIAAGEQQKNRECKSILLFGGMFSSLAKGQAPNDLDMIICNPDIVDRMRRAAMLSIYGADRGMNEMMQAEIDHHYKSICDDNENFKINHTDVKPLQGSKHMGAYLQLAGTVTHEGKETKVDIVFCEKEVDPVQLLCLMTDAPVRSAGYDVNTGEYIYHRDFERHVNDWVFEPFDPETVREGAIKKAETKGMTIVM